MPTKRILVDGYNVIRRTPRWNDLFRRDMAEARSALLQHCATMKARHRDISEIVVIFDGDSSVASHPAPNAPGVRAIFTSTGVEADERIVEAVRSGTPRETLVVSDDAEVIGKSRRLGASVASAAQFQQGAIAHRGSTKPKPKVPDAKSDLTPSQEREINAEMRRTFGGE